MLKKIKNIETANASKGHTKLIKLFFPIFCKNPNNWKTLDFLMTSFVVIFMFPIPFSTLKVSSCLITLKYNENIMS